MPVGFGNVPYGGTNLGSGGGGGPVTPPTNTNISPTDSDVNGAGSTAAGVYQISVANIGGANGTFNGQTLFVGMTMTYTAYLDLVTNQMKRIGSLAYDATGTTFRISETP